MPSRNVKCRIPRFQVLLHRECIRYGDSPLGRLFHGFLNSIHIDLTNIWPEVFIVRGLRTDIMLVGPKNMLVGHEGKTGVKVNHESSKILRVCIALWVIPKFIKVRVKGKSLIRVIGPRRLPITRWVV